MSRLKKANNLTQEVYNYLKENYPEDVLEWVKEASWSLKTVPLDDINMARRPGGRNMEKVKGIAKAVNEGKPMDPVVLVKCSDGTYQVADGYHRTLGFKHAGKDKIKAYVATGVGDHGPWDEEMHAKKLNVEPGKVASRLSKLIRKADYSTLYHGTSVTSLDKIKDSGAIIPQASPGSMAIEEGYEEATYQGYVFMSDDILYTLDYCSMAMSSEGMYDYRDLCPVLEIDVSGLKLLPDWQDCPDCKTAEESLEEIHQCSFKGEIPTSRIKAVLLMDYQSGEIIVRSTLENWKADFEANKEKFGF